VNEISGKYLGYLVQPVKKHRISTIGILYQRISIGGVETFISTMCRMLMRMGYDVILLANEINEKVVIPDGVKVERIEGQKWNDERAISLRMGQVKNAIRKHKIDLIFS
jgi:hypothetical protein